MIKNKQARRPVEEEVFAKMDREERADWESRSAAEVEELTQLVSDTHKQPYSHIDDYTSSLDYMPETDNAEEIQGTDSETNMMDEIIDTILRCHYVQNSDLQHKGYAEERKVLDENREIIDEIVLKFVRAYDPTLRLVRDGEIIGKQKPMHMRSYLRRKRVWSYLIAKPDRTARDLEERFSVTQPTMRKLLLGMKSDGSAYHNDRHPREWRAVENFVWR